MRRAPRGFQEQSAFLWKRCQGDRVTFPGFCYLQPVMGPLQIVHLLFGFRSKQESQMTCPSPHCFSLIGGLTTSKQAGQFTLSTLSVRLEALRESLSCRSSCFNAMCLVVASFLWATSSDFSRETSCFKSWPAFSVGLEQGISSSKSSTSTSKVNLPSTNRESCLIFLWETSSPVPQPSLSSSAAWRYFGSMLSSTWPTLNVAEILTLKSLGLHK